MEIDRFWSFPRITWGSLFFYANRYLSVLGYMPLLFKALWNTDNPADKVEVSVSLFLG
jgi:hypothetical protein